MKTNKVSKSIQKSEQSNTITKIITNLNEIDLNSIKTKRKLSFSSVNANDKSKVWKLLKRTTSAGEFSLKNLKKDKNFSNSDSSLKIKDNPINQIKFKENPIKNKCRKNFVLKSELYELNKKQEKIKSPIFRDEEKDNKNINNSNNYSPDNLLEFREDVKNTNKINNIKELNDISQENIISNYNQSYSNNTYSMQNLNNNINYNEIQNNESNEYFQNLRNDNSISQNNSYNNNYINFNINNIYFGNTFIPSAPYFNYNNNNNFNLPINNIQNPCNNKFNDNSNIIYLTKTQSGCQTLKSKIISDSNYANDILFPNIINNLKEICKNFFGSSMIQTLLQVLKPENMDLFLIKISGDILEICLTESGSLVMQALIGKIKNNNNLLNKLIFYLNNTDLKKIFKSAYGHHFFKYYLSIIHNEEFTNFIYILICENFVEIATDKFGVCIIQRAFGEFEKRRLDTLFKLTEQNFDLLIKHCFGNYLIQYIFIKLKNKFQFNIFFPLIKKIENNLVDFCKDKYSSSVLEKFFEKGDEKINEYILNYLLNFHSNEIVNLIIHSNGFYVIKKAMYIKNKNIKQRIMKAILNNRSKIESGSKNELIIDSFCKEFSEFY